MDFLHMYDWITPTNPFASLFFGIIFTIIMSFVIWFETKERKTTGIALGTGISVTIVGVIFLNAIGHYG